MGPMRLVRLMNRSPNPGPADTLFKLALLPEERSSLVYFFLVEGLGEAATVCFAGWNISFLAPAHFCC
jgi:hypothetical protein